MAKPLMPSYEETLLRVKSGWRRTLCLSATVTALCGYSFGDLYAHTTSHQVITVAQQSKNIVVTGTVVDSKGESIPGVNVLVKNSNPRVGARTNMDGEFTINMNATSDKIILVVSFIGFKTQEVPVALKNGTLSPVKIILREDSKSLGEVVVTGMFTRKKEGFTGSIVTLKGDEIKNLSTTNISKALSIIEPGLRIMDNVSVGSDPNKLPDLRMRGQTTLPGGATSSDAISLKGEYNTFPNQPLLLLDGFEIGIQTLMDLDPDRVSSITILKDASATAIYGSRASNGVIVIETYAPKEGTLNVSYNGNVRMETPDLSAYNLMEAEDKLYTEHLAGLYAPQDLDALRDYQSRLREVKRGVNTYWLAQPLRTAWQQRHALTLEGGSQVLRYKLYAGMNLTPGVMKGSERKTQTMALDLSYRFSNLLMKNSVTVDNSVSNNSPYGDFAQYARLNPYLRPYGKDGEINKVMQAWNMLYNNSNIPYEVSNPLYNTTFHSLDRNSTFQIRNLFKLEYKPIDALRVSADISVRKGVGKGEVFKPAQHTDFTRVVDPTLKGSFRRDQSEDFGYSLDLTASYDNAFNDAHYVTGNVRYSIQENSRELYGATATGFPNDAMDNILFGKRYNDNLRGSEGTSRLVGGVLTMGYSYKYKYSFDFNLRVDGSSQFGKDNRFAPFWSAGAKWNINKENFLKEVSWLNDLVFSVSYGVTGTQGFSPYQSRFLYTYGNLMRPYISSDATGTELVALGNKNLKWQQAETWNYRLETSLFDGRLTARAEYYRKFTKNSLAQLTIAPSIGFTSYPENIGSVQNQGVEFNLSFIPYKDVSKDAYLVVTLNGAHNRDKLVKVSEALRKMNESNAANSLKTNAPLPQYQEGESLTRIWVMKSYGIDPATGDEILVRRDGSLTSIYDPAELVPIGSTEPLWQGNINTSFNYKGFGANLSFNYQFGGQVYNQTLVDKVENADLRYNVDKRVLTDRWQKPGDLARYKRLTNSIGGADTKATSRFIMDNNIFRMSTLSLSYRMDGKNTAFLKKSFVKSMKWGATVEDLFYLSTVKRERGLSYPFARQFSLSLNLVF